MDTRDLSVWPVGRSRGVGVLARIAVLFGGIAGQVGWGLVAFGSIFFWAFGADHSLATLVRYRGEKKTSEGVVADVDKTNVSVGGGKHTSGTPVYRYKFRFAVPEMDKEFTGTCYTTGKRYQEGEAVSVEYLVRDPEHARIAGTRMSIMGGWAALLLILPGIGLAMALGSLRTGWRRMELLANGQFARAALVGEEPTNTRINGRTVMKLTMEFDESGRKHRFFARTHKPERIDRENGALALYDPVQPERAVLLSALPCNPAPTGSGDIDVGAPLPTLFLLLLPFVAILGNLAVIVGKLKG